MLYLQTGGSRRLAVPVRVAGAGFTGQLPEHCCLDVRTETACEGEKKVIGFRLMVPDKAGQMQVKSISEEHSRRASRRVSNREVVTRKLMRCLIIIIRSVSGLVRSLCWCVSSWENR